MSQLNRIAVVVAMLTAASPSPPARACGPDFPTNLITRRAESLQTLWDGSFLAEAGKLVPAPPDLVAAPIPSGDLPSPSEVAIYNRGAVAFHNGDLAAADRAFEEVLRLPADQRRHRSTWAAFMLHDHARLRQLIHDGFYDEQELGKFELGERARQALAADHIEDALALYAQQAAAGDTSGAVSLLFVVRKLVATPATLARTLGDPVGLRLVAAYYYTRKNELGDHAPALWPALRERAMARGIGLHLLAAAAYRDGNWADAAAFAARTPDETISKWVLAKLALRDGDTKTARRYLAEVEAAHPTSCNVDDGQLDRRDLRPASSAAEGRCGSIDPTDLARGDLGLVALSDQHFVEAMSWFRAAKHYSEASYVFDRVLTPDEARGVVGAPPARTTPYVSCAWLDDEGEPTDKCWSDNLPTIFARRLMRLGRFDEAVPYFDPSVRAPASAYAELFRDQRDTDDPVEVAEKLFAAARLAREQGMPMMGTEHAPDWTMYDGDYARATLCPPNVASTVDSVEDPEDGCVAPSAADRPFISSTETARVADSAPADDKRYHYRYLASWLAEDAARYLPPRSQAFAETLCQAASYVRYIDVERATKLYQRYVAEGAAGFGAEFGDRCDAPDFHRARTFERDHAPPSRYGPARWRATFAHHPWLWLPAHVLLGAIALLLARRRS